MLHKQSPCYQELFVLFQFVINLRNEPVMKNEVKVENDVKVEGVEELNSIFNLDPTLPDIALQVSDIAK